MDTDTALRRVLAAPAFTGRPYAELTDDHPSHPPIYAQLVAEWRADDRLTPDRHDVRQVLWASFAAPAPEAGGPWHAVSWADDRQEQLTGHAAAVPERDVPERDVPKDEVEPVPAVPLPRGLPDW